MTLSRKSAKRFRYLVYIILFIISFIIIFRYYFGNKKPSPELVLNTKNLEPKLILIYNTLWGNKLWTGLETTEKWNNWGGHPCKIQNCRVTYNKKLLGKADVVLFHAFGNDMLTPRELQKIQKDRNPNSYWIYFLHECPHNAKPEPYLYDGLFNWTMGYRHDSDIFVPYNWEWGTWEERSRDEKPILFRNHAEDKDKLIWSGISHCGCMRERYIHKLRELVNVDVFGNCANKFYKDVSPPVCERGTSECKTRLKRYKFYLAFENSFCDDYVTEKFSETILDGHTVPIVMGGANYKKIALPNSYIDVNDFDTVEDLANYIKYLDENDNAYNKHFEYKKFWKLGEPRAWSCKICEMINSIDLKPKSYQKLGEWYSVQNTCGTKLKKLRKIMHKSGVPHPYTDEYYLYEYAV